MQENQFQEIETLFEDDTIIVFNKPANVVVNEAETQNNPTLETWLRIHKNITVERSGIVHRLDKDTSGVLVVAKTEAAMINLQAQFKERTVEKEYVALVHGAMEAQGTISTNLARNPSNRHKFVVSSEGKPAQTSWKVEQYYNLSPEKMSDIFTGLNKNQKRYVLEYAAAYALLRLFPKTGRTHQIRVHVSALRHPIVSDKVYCSRKLVKFDEIWCKRQFLHAALLKIAHPVSGELLTFSAVLPPDLQTALSTLDKKVTV